MGTGWSVRFVAPTTRDVAPVAAAIEAELDLVVAQMSSWEDDSDLGRFNRAPAGSWHGLPPAFASVMAAGLKLMAASDGAFDPGMGALVNLWGFGPEAARSSPPPSEEIKAAKARRDAGQLQQDGAALLQPGGVMLDLSGIAKGHAVDRLSDHLMELGLRCHLVEIGGELRGAGVKPDGAPWWVGLMAPRGLAVDPELVVALHGLAIATSADERSFLYDGRRYSHTIDPRTGWPIEHETVQVSVLHPCCMLADAWATALLVLGSRGGLELAEREGLAAAFLGQGHDRAAGPLSWRLSPAMAAMLE